MPEDLTKHPSEARVDSSASWLPAFVIGYRHPGETPDMESSARPEWLYCIDHESGGYGCSVETLSGAILSLNTNHNETTPQTWLLTRAMQEMGESWRADNAPAVEGIAHEMCELVAHGSGGEAVDVPALSEFLRLYLARGEMEPAAVEWGTEAVLGFEEWPVLPYFRGWHLTLPAPPSAEAFTDNQPYLVGDAFSDEHLHALTKWGEAMGYGGPRVFLIWENGG